MSRLVVIPEHEPRRHSFSTADAHAITATLAPWGVRFERWTPAATSPDPLVAYAPQVERLRADGYGTVDVVRVAPDAADPGWPDKARAMRAKFRDDHTHAEDEVRFFAEGAGVFYLLLGGSVHCVLCEAGGLLSVPAGTVHWFDMGEVPRFTAIRFFQKADGWIGSFSAEPIARSFPSFDELSA
jgi:1,2-dihydroxy-3-keto-5-methylthiopentene dioxygenase